MNKLILKLSTGVETIVIPIINKLYSSVIYEPVSENIEMSGSLLVQHSYESEVTYLRNRFQNLNINVTEGYYIKFESPLLENFLSSKIGDQIGVTMTDAATKLIGGLTGWFRDWSEKSTSCVFNEFKYFTSTLNSPPVQCFRDWIGLTEIDCNNIPTFISLSMFEGCTNLSTVTGLDNVTEVRGSSFLNCKKCALTQDDFPSLNKVGYRSFYSSGITGTWDFTGWTASNIDNSSFQRSGITGIILPSSVANAFNSTPLFYNGCTEVTTFQSDFENWTYIASFKTMNKLEPFVLYLPKILDLSDGSSIFGGDWINGFVDGPATWKQVYWPAVTSLLNAAWFNLGGTNFEGLFKGSRGSLNMLLLYLKDVTLISAWFWNYGILTALVIDNLVPPTIVNHARGSSTGTSVTHFYSEGNGVRRNITNIYVPDSAVTTYLTAWPEHSSVILGISLLNGGTWHYATEAAWEAAGKPTALIDEYTIIPSN